MSAHLEKLVTDWRDAIHAIDKMKAEEDQRAVPESERLTRINHLLAKQNALLKYATEEMG